MNIYLLIDLIIPDVPSINLYQIWLPVEYIR